jgi:hypothetical protein
MPSAADLEAYMDEMEKRYFAMHPDEKCGARRNWSGYRKYLARVREGLVPGTTLETDTPRAAEHLLGLQRALGEALHPRRSIRKRQLQTLVSAGHDCAHLLAQPDAVELAMYVDAVVPEVRSGSAEMP